MMDPSTLMRMAQAFSAPPSAAADNVGPRITLALLAAVENRDCSCEPCEHLRGLVQAMREQARAVVSSSSPRDVPVT